MEHPDLRFEIVYGVSDNRRAWYDNANAKRLGYQPRDRGEDYAAEVLAKEPPVTDERAETFQGGTFVTARGGGGSQRADHQTVSARPATGQVAEMADARRLAIKAPYVLAHDGRGHCLLRDGVVVVEGDRILAVGPRFDGPGGRNGGRRRSHRDPGLISTHAHIAGSPLDRSFIEDRGNPQFGYSGLFEMLPVRAEAQDEEASRACIDFSMAELLRGGVTTVMEIGPIADHVVARAGHYGMRGVPGAWLFAPGVGSQETVNASNGSGTRSGAPGPAPGGGGLHGSTTAPTAISCAASSRRPRSTPAPPSS